MKYVITILFLLLQTLYAKTYVISGGKNNPVHIIASKILKVAYKRANLKIKPKFVQLNKSLILSNNGEVDGELARVEKISKIYPNLQIVPIPLITVRAVAFSKDASIRIDTWDDLNNYHITIVNGAKFIETATHGIKKAIVKNFNIAFKNMQDEKTQIVVVPKLAGLKIIYLNNYYNIHSVSKALQSLKLYHFVHKDNANLIPILTPILQDMKDSGEIDYWARSYLNSIRTQ